MNKRLFVVSALFLCLSWVATRGLQTVPAGRAASALADSALPTSGIVSPATAFLNSLEADQRGKATFAYGDEERFNWHFIPRARKGIPMNELNEGQKAKLRSLLEASLSRAGYEKAEQVRFLEALLRDLEGAGRRFSRDPELYFASFFGRPAESGRWGWRLEGHHLCCNFSLDGGKLVSATPLFYGANPAIVRSGPKKGLRVLAGMEDVARQLARSLDESQRKAAFGEPPVEVKGTRSARYDEALPRGLTADRLSPEQRKTLDRLISEYTVNLKEESRRDIERDIQGSASDKITFVWRGSTNAWEGHSYLVHGPTFVISYANFQNDAAHVHAGLRDTSGEFGLPAKTD